MMEGKWSKKAYRLLEGELRETPLLFFSERHSKNNFMIITEVKTI